MPKHQILGVATYLTITASNVGPIRHLILRFNDVVAPGKGNAWEVDYQKNPTGICIGTDEPPPSLVGRRDGSVFVDFGAVGLEGCTTSVEIVPEKLGYHTLTIQGFASGALNRVSLRELMPISGATVRLAAWQTQSPWGTPLHPARPGTLRLTLTGRLGRPSLTKPYVPLYVHIGYMNGWTPDLRLRYRGSRYLQPYPGQEGGMMCGIAGRPVGTSLYDFVYDYGPNPQRAGCNVELGLNVLGPGKYLLVLQAYDGDTRVSSATVRLWVSARARS